MGIKHVISFLFVAAYFVVKAQEPYSRVINVSNGLPSDAVYSILEDSKNFIWITCNDGLLKYDGKTFTSFKEKNQNSFAGSALQEDCYGRIWYQNFDGQCYYVSDNKLYALEGYKRDNYLEQFFTREHLFVFEKNGIAVFDLKSLKRIKTIQLTDFSNAPKFIVWNNEFYYIYNDWLYHVSKKLEVKKITHLPNGYLLDFKSTSSKDGIYIQVKTTEGHEIWKYSKNAWFKVHLLKEDLVIQSLAFIDEKLWVQTTKGAFVFKDKQVDFSAHYLASKNLSNVIKDRKNNYWFTSPIEAITIVPQFSNYLYDCDNYQGLKFLIKENEILFSTHKDELIKLNLKTNKTQVVYQGVNNAQIYYLYEDAKNQNTIFVASDGKTYFVRNGDFKNPTSYNIAVKQVAKIDENLYAFVSSGAFGFIKIGTDKNGPFPAWLSNLKYDSKEEKNGITIYLCKSHERSKALLFDSLSKSIYYSTTNECFLFKNGKYTQIDPKNSMVNFVSFMNFDKRIFGLGVNGILYEILPSLKCVNVSEEFDLAGQMIWKISFLEGKIVAKTDGKILVLGRNRLNKFRIQNFFDLQNQSCYDYKLKDGFAWMLTNNGLIRWNYSKPVQATVLGKWTITEATFNGASFDWNKKQSFSQSKNNVLLKFSILDFGLQTIEKIQYRINNESWQDISPDVRFLNFPALSSGNHIIELRAKFINGTYDTKKIFIDISKPFWMTIWFYTFLFIVCLGFVIFGFRHQIRQIKLRNSLMTEKINLESDLNKSLLASIKSQMNPHFIFNALNTIQAYIYMNDKKNATGYLSKFSKLTRHILELSEKEKVQVSEEIKALELYLELEKMRFQSDFKYSISHEKIDSSGIIIPSMLIQPYVENAIKHGLLHLEGKKELNIQFWLDGTDLIVEIEDNGIGRKRSSEIQAKRAENHESFSSKANETRLKLLNNDQSVGVQILDKYSTDQQPLGTKVTLTIKIKE